MKHRHNIATLLLLLGVNACSDSSAPEAASDVQSASALTAPLASIFDAQHDCKASIANFWRCNEGLTDLKKTVAVAAEAPTAPKSGAILPKLLAYTNRMTYKAGCKSTKPLDVRVDFGSDEQSFTVHTAMPATADKIEQSIPLAGGSYTVSVSVPDLTTIVVAGCQVEVEANATVPELNFLEDHVSGMKSTYLLMKNLATFTDVGTDFSVIKGAIKSAVDDYNSQLALLAGQLDRAEDPADKTTIQNQITATTGLRDGLATSESDFTSKCTSGTLQAPDAGGDVCAAPAPTSTDAKYAFCLKTLCQARQAVFAARDAVAAEANLIDTFVDGEGARIAAKTDTVLVKSAEKIQMAKIVAAFDGLMATIKGL